MDYSHIHEFRAARRMPAHSPPPPFRSPLFSHVAMGKRLARKALGFRGSRDGAVFKKVESEITLRVLVLH